jgi:hypothetical protein
MRFKFFLLLTLSTSLFADMGAPFALNQDREIVINNRVLLKVEGETISLMDVVKKMDLLFYRQYPQYASSPELRYQFYMVNWRDMFSSVIDDHLILADAKEKKIEVTDGDIRESMEDLFGPDVVISLDKVGLSYQEARELIKTELIVRRMMGMMVRSKAQFDVNPKEVKKLYEQVAKKAPLDETWVYKMLTIQTKEEEKGKSLAAKALDLLENQKVPFEELVTHLQCEEAEVRLSEEYKRSQKDLSTAHKNVLESMGIGSCSHPIVQTSKKDGTHLVRIFHLKDKEKAKEPTLKDLEAKLSEELLAKSMERHTAEYLEKLRKHYGITEPYLEDMVPGDFHPFALK